MKTIYSILNNRFEQAAFKKYVFKHLLKHFFLLWLSFGSHSSFGQITRTQIINNAAPYASYTWTASQCNLWNGTFCNGDNVYKAPWVGVGSNTGMPYCWAGMSTPATHDNAMNNCKSAGQVCSSGGGGCVGSPGVGLGCASGDDCSGFISRAWALYIKRGKLMHFGFEKIETSTSKDFSVQHYIFG